MAVEDQNSLLKRSVDSSEGYRQNEESRVRQVDYVASPWEYRTLLNSKVSLSICLTINPLLFYNHLENPLLSSTGHSKLVQSQHSPKKNPILSDGMSEQVKIQSCIFYAAIIFPSDRMGFFLGRRPCRQTRIYASSHNVSIAFSASIT